MVDQVTGGKRLFDLLDLDITIKDEPTARPLVVNEGVLRFENVEFASDAIAAAKDADALVIVTEWDEFRALDLDKVAEAMRGKTLVDLRNVYDRDEAVEAGLAYFGVGRGRSGGSSRAS